MAGPKETIEIKLWKQEPIRYEITHGEPPVVRWPAKLELEPLVHAAAQVNRHTGQTEKPYSILEHSCRLRYVVNERLRIPACNVAALLHDLPETMGINDLHTRIKAVLAPEVRELEEVVMQGLWDRFGPPSCSGPWSFYGDLIKPFDRELGLYETHQLFTPGNAGVWHWSLVEFGNPTFEVPDNARRHWMELYRRDVR